MFVLRWVLFVPLGTRRSRDLIVTFLPNLFCIHFVRLLWLCAVGLSENEEKKRKYFMWELVKMISETEFWRLNLNKIIVFSHRQDIGQFLAHFWLIIHSVPAAAATIHYSRCTTWTLMPRYFFYQIILPHGDFLHRRTSTEHVLPTPSTRTQCANWRQLYQGRQTRSKYQHWIIESLFSQSYMK